MSVRSCRLLPLTLSLMLALSGCGTVLHEEDGAELASRESDIRIANSLTTHALVLNAISANPDSNDKLATTGLAALFNPANTVHAATHRRLGDPDAQKFMSYLVSCALLPGQTINWRDPLSSPPVMRQWEGKAGLCPQWATSAPTSDCLERVSSCLLARNNALGQRVELSMRGEHAMGTFANVYTLEAQTRPAEHDPVSSVHLSSFQACGSGQSGPLRDCGWKADGIGVCDASGTVLIGAGGPTSCSGPAPTLGSSTTFPTVLRVCRGVAGCNHADARNLGEATGSCSGTSPVPVATISCTPGTYFSVMTAPWSSTTAHGTVDVDVSAGSTARYALPETEVYGVREGAFYGTVFGRMVGGVSSVLARGVNVDVQVVRTGETVQYHVVGDTLELKGSIYTKMFSCYDPDWASGPAYSASRLCALPDSTMPGQSRNCAARVTGACFTSLNPPTPGQCALQEGPVTPGDRDYEQCTDTYGNVWMHPVTTFLHAACDTVPERPADGAVCQQTR
ncbi:hypothetical protein [Pyxidicoccus xibeiensis]|uniref:hypothetical protein n=1 Tax=Pyxidicoccus xibeiensis TaxID=2906759 RepID=UPI0020A71E83|nr:hypothetical protein [Pyxidicoccus xibeiensis]MCP3144934.1 hypothetical protein [Pyxidicoccus xibeiensis]